MILQSGGFATGSICFNKQGSYALVAGSLSTCTKNHVTRVPSASTTGLGAYIFSHVASHGLQTYVLIHVYGPEAAA